jgi:DNA repair protein RAD50
MSPFVVIAHTQLSEQIAPLKQRVDAKEQHKGRAMKLMEEEEEKFTDIYSNFTSSVQELNRIISVVDEYLKSSKAEEVADLEKENDRLAESEKEKRKEHQGMKPELDRLTKMVDDHDRERKNLEENIQLIQATENIEGLRKDIAELEKELSRVEGRETLGDDETQLAKRRNHLIADMARQDGRKGEIIETIRGLKRKLSQPEYRDVEEQYRIANIKHDTSEMAVKDIDKYHSAVDKALQRYHSIKISEINTIIRDLWTLTYKGEDINNIEIVSGQESGSRSTRSYNYRVVMEKSGSKMDMRGRCSAGQRVLASIVIRLALAETFCVNFGCIALDEPTVNLDYKNKKGLAVALAQIIASRQQQSNFQLVLITHDEDFVVMMKNELSVLTNVSMPEKYFQIHREEGSDGKYYSKIDAVDWEELL